MSGEFDIKELKGEEWLKKLNILNELNEARKIETIEEKEYKEVLMKDFGFEERTVQHSQVNGHNFTIRFLGKTDLNLPFHIQFFYFIWSVIPNCRVRSF